MDEKDQSANSPENRAEKNASDVNPTLNAEVLSGTPEDINGASGVMSESGASVPGTNEVSTAESSIAATQRSGFMTIFVGPNGIRAGWRLLIYFCVVFLLSAGIRLVVHRLVAPPPRGQTPSPTFLVVSELIAFVVAVIAAVIMAWIEKEKWSHYGLPLRRAISRDFWFGCLWGFAALAVILGILRLGGAYHIDGLALTGGPAVKYALVWGAMFLLVGLFEEFSIRGYLLYTLASGIWFWPAAVITSSLFFIGHIRNPGENWYGLADVFVIGMFFCFTLWRTGDLWFAVGMHATWDWGQSYFFSVPDSGLVVPGHLFKMHMSGPAWLSGGSVGPEGSVVNLIADILFFFIFAAVYRKRKWMGVADWRKKRQAESGRPEWALAGGAQSMMGNAPSGPAGTSVE